MPPAGPVSHAAEEDRGAREEDRANDQDCPGVVARRLHRHREDDREEKQQVDPEQGEHPSDQELSPIRPAFPANRAIAAVSRERSSTMPCTWKRNPPPIQMIAPDTRTNSRNWDQVTDAS